MSEEDGGLDNTYSSEQPLIDCGFLGADKFFALTSVNTVEICNMEDSNLFTSIGKFPHQVDYIISTQVLHHPNKEDILLIHCGNNLGEVFIYQVDYNRKQLVDPETGMVKEDNIKLVNMIATDP